MSSSPINPRCGLTVALKNDVEQLADLAPYFDYAVNDRGDPRLSRERLASPPADDAG